MRGRKMLDLFCGGGLAGAGYWQSGCFSEIVGVDLDPSMKKVYPFDFLSGNVWALDYEFLSQFDFIHASPPCQFYSAITPSWARERHIRSIPPTHLMLQSSGKPYVIENVPGSGHDLRPNLIMSGLDVGLPTARPRLFHISNHPGTHKMNGRPGSHNMSGSSGTHINTWMIANVSIEEISQINTQGNSQMIGDRIFNVHGEEYISRDEMIEAFGLRSLSASHLRRMTKTHIEQGIPPLMTKRIALMLFERVMIGEKHERVSRCLFSQKTDLKSLNQLVVGSNPTGVTNE
jgi:DNA (cytosine-5)-methyltransferase 1